MTGGRRVCRSWRTRRGAATLGRAGVCRCTRVPFGSWRGTDPATERCQGDHRVGERSASGVAISPGRARPRRAAAKVAPDRLIRGSWGPGRSSAPPWSGPGSHPCAVPGSGSFGLQDRVSLLLPPRISTCEALLFDRSGIRWANHSMSIEPRSPDDLLPTNLGVGAIEPGRVTR